MSAHSAGAYTATLLVMVNVIKGVGVHPPARANFTLITECTSESSRCNSVYSVGERVTTTHYSLHPNTFSDPDMVRARICKCLWSPGIDSEESISPGWESILGLLKRSTNTGSCCGGEGEDAESKKKS